MLPVYSNCFMTPDAPLADIQARFYSCAEEIPPTEIFRIIKRAEWSCYNAGLYAGSRGNKIYFLTSGRNPPQDIDVDKYHFRLEEGTVRLLPVQDQRVLETIFSWALKKRVYSLGLQGPENQVYYDPAPYKQDYFDFHDGFACDSEVLPDGHIVVWLDPKIRWKQPVSVAIKWLKAHGNSDEEIKTHLLGRRVRCPTPAKNKMYDASIGNIKFQDLGSFPWEHEGKKMSLYVYWMYRATHKAWLARKHIALDPKESPVIIVEADYFPNGEKPYPPSVLEFPVDLNNPEIPEDAFGEKITTGPSERVDLTLKKFDKLLLERPFSLGPVKVSFKREMLNWGAVPFKHVEVDELTPPGIRFGDGFILEPVSSRKEPNLAQALASHGPITVKEAVPITMILPRSLVGFAPRLQQFIIQSAARLRLGRYDFQDPILLDNQTPDDYQRVCNLNGRKLSNTVALVILPQSWEEKAYNKAKRGLGGHYISSQMLYNKTFMRVARWDGVASALALNSILQNISAQIYDKALIPGECIWQLARPAGGIDPSQNIFFMGFDVSRSYETKREAAAYAAVCDVYGRIITRQVLGSHKGEKILASDLSDWFFEAGCSAYDTCEVKRPVDGIMFFKDGPIRPNQLPEFEGGSLQAHERLITQGIMTRESDIKVISVTKRGPQRIYADPLGRQQVSPRAVYFGTTQAMGVTSTPRTGTPEVLRLSLDYQIKNTMGIKQIYHIFNDLRYLDYSSLFMQPKTILPLHIVQNLAKLSKDDIEVPYITR